MSKGTGQSSTSITLFDSNSLATKSRLPDPPEFLIYPFKIIFYLPFSSPLRHQQLASNLPCEGTVAYDRVRDPNDAVESPRTHQRTVATATTASCTTTTTTTTTLSTLLDVDHLRCDHLGEE